MHALAVVERTGIDRLHHAADDAALHVLAEAEGILAEQLDGGQSHEFQTRAGEGVCADDAQRAGAGEVCQRAEIGAGVGIDKLDGIGQVDMLQRLCRGERTLLELFDARQADILEVLAGVEGIAADGVMRPASRS